jgi:hypothetical protein
LYGIWKILGCWFFWGNLSRRGTHVNIPKIGSRAGEKCFGGILGIHAVLRREIKWRNWDLGFLGVFLVVPLGATEEGDHLVLLLCV